MKTRKSLYSNKAKGRWKHRHGKNTDYNLKKDGKYVNVYRMMSFWVPTTYHKRLKEISKRTDVPMSRLILNCIHKEFMRGGEFKYGFNIPHRAEHNTINVAAAEKIYEFIKLFKYTGVSIELAYFSMVDLEIYEPKVWLDAYRLLLNSGAIIEFKVEKDTGNKRDNKVRAADELGFTPKID